MSLIGVLLSLPLMFADDGSLLARVEARARRTSDLTAEFVQSYRSSAIGKELTERGTVRIKRPGRMLWEYAQPEKKLFVSDGKTFYFYVPADKQVIVRDQAGARGVAVALLSGEGFASQFDAVIDTQDGATRLKLTPRAGDPEVERVYLETDADARIVGLEIWDAQGSRSRFRFEKLRENQGLSDKLFRFEVPKGVAVIAG